MNQLALNKKIEELIRSKDKKGEKYYQEDKQLLVQYEGSGGQGSKGATGEGVLYEYYI